jgi:hypothetical protein
LRRNKAQLSVSDYYKKELLGFKVDQSQRVVDVSGNEYYRFSVKADLGEKFSKKKFKSSKAEARQLYKETLSVGRVRKKILDEFVGQAEARKKELGVKDNVLPIEPKDELLELLSLKKRKGLSKFLNKMRFGDFQGMFQKVWKVRWYDFDENLPPDRKRNGEWIWRSKLEPITDFEQLGQAEVEWEKWLVVEQFYKDQISPTKIILSITLESFIFSTPTRILQPIRASALNNHR